METILQYVAVSASVILTCVTFVFIIALLKKDNSIIDICYGLFYIAVVWTLPFWFTEYTPVQFLLMVLVTLWGTRLALRIGYKNWGKPEDKRYNNWRVAWMKKGFAYFLARTYVQIFLLQGFIVFLVVLPVVLVGAVGGTPYVEVLALGLIVWLIGFFFEVVADYQLDVFLKNKDNRGKIMTKGLFKYTRRPNYFGESMMWWGIAITSMSVLPSLYALIAFISPITITYIVYAVTGPITEALWEGNKEYQAYAQKTNYFFPGPQKS